MEDLDTLILRLRPDARTAVVALTHDPKLDDLACRPCMDRQACTSAARHPPRSRCRSWRKWWLLRMAFS